MKLGWVSFSLIAMILIGVFNILQMLVNKNIQSDVNLGVVYMRAILICSGILSALTFLIPGVQLNRKLMNDGLRFFDPKLLIGSAIVFSLINIAILFAYSKGGSLAGVIINLNLLIVLFYGYFILKEKINTNIMIAMLIYLLSGAYIVYEKNRLVQG